MKPTSKEVINELCKILDATPKEIKVIMTGFMTPREKAVRLVDRYLDEVINETDINFPLELPKRLALIAVHEILKAVESDWSFMEVRQDYWKEVKQEIEKL
jgi:hypothetical protein